MVNPQQYYTDPEYLKLLYKSHIIIHNLLIKNNIAYWSSGGTTLGAMRGKQIIKWDNDLDYEISYRDVSYLMSKDFKNQLAKKGHKIKYHKEYGSKDKYDWLKIYSLKKVSGKKSDIDLFPVYFEKDNNNKIRTYYYSQFARKYWSKSFLYLDELLPLKKQKFGDGYMIVPNKAKKYLDRMFGKNWNKIALITQEKETHYELDEPIKLTVKDFNKPGKYYSAKTQTHLENNDILLTLKGYGF